MIKNKPLALAFLLLNIVPMTALRLCDYLFGWLISIAEWLDDKAEKALKNSSYMVVLWLPPYIATLLLSFVFVIPSGLSPRYHGWVTRIAGVKLHWKKPYISNT